MVYVLKASLLRFQQSLTPEDIQMTLHLMASLIVGKEWLCI